ncbi:MAG: hypothetical protein OEM91_01780 [Hyphomicrobiales bacterium]|nr:hypothetical protein [Hyphomicrobiales bacterium]
MAPYDNEHLLADSNARAALAEIVDVCRSFAVSIPETEPAQARALKEVIERTGSLVQTGRLRLCDTLPKDEPVIRLYKAQTGVGRLKLQLFPLQNGDSHPPHAHYNLVSCQIVLQGEARIREYSLLSRSAANELEIRAEPEQRLQPGDGVYTLLERNNIHWQEGLCEDTVLLNINWQGYFDADPMLAHGAINGRRYIDWDRARAGSEPGCLIVPKVNGA